jgi:hypothetical protein
MVSTNPAWTLVQIADLLRRAEDSLLEALAILGPNVHVGIAEQAACILEADGSLRLKDAMSEVCELGQQLGLLVSAVPSGGVEIRHDQVAAGAFADLADGIIDPGRALLAAQVLDVPSGWGALAVGLASSDVATVWEGTTLEMLIGRFRGADPRLARAVIAEADLAPEMTFAHCSPADLARLAAALQQRAVPGSS